MLWDLLKYDTDMKKIASEKMVQTDLFNTGLPQILNVQKNAISSKHNKAKCNKTRYACTSYINLWSVNSFKEKKKKKN